MKRFLFFLLALFMFRCAEAQVRDGTDGNGFYLQLFLPDGSKPLFASGNGGYMGSFYGVSVIGEMEGEVAWVRTAAGDSLGCDTAVNDLTGKFALVRRGTCEFGTKAWNAELAGAKAVLIANNHKFPWDDENTVISMGIPTVGVTPQVPFIFVCRKVGEIISNAIDNGQLVTAKFTFPTLKEPHVVYHYATPKSQVDSLKHINVHFFNPTADTLHDASVKAEIIEPGGNIVELDVQVASLAPRQDTLLVFPPYLPPSVAGNYEAIFSNNLFSERIDTVKRKFRITDNFWALDNGQIVPGEGVYWGGEIEYFHLYQTGALYRTGPNRGVASHIQFGLANADTLISPDNEEYQIGVALYDADSDNEGENDFEESWEDLELVATGIYEVTGNEPVDSLLTASLVSVFPGEDSVYLKPRHLYYACLVNADPYTFLMPRYTLTTKESYPDPLWEPVQFDDELWLSWIQKSKTFVQRLYTIEQPLPSAAPNLLASSKFTLSPNPANEFFQIDLSLSAVNEKAAVSLYDWQGRAVISEKRTDFQEGSISFEVKNLPSGAYLLWVRTEEGHAMRQVMICH